MRLLFRDYWLRFSESEGRTSSGKKRGHFIFAVLYDRLSSHPTKRREEPNEY